MCLQVSQSSSSHSVPSSSGQRPIHLTKSVLLARISTELKSLGEEYARKEQLRIQKTASCSQLDNIEGIIVPPPKENIGPGSRSRRSGEGTSLTSKASGSGVLQQRAKTLSVANLPGSSRKKQKSSASGSGGPLRPVPKSKFRRSKTQESSLQTSSGSGDSGFTEEGNAENEAKTPPNMELCATPKRLKVSGKGSSGRLRRKQGAWTVKPIETEDKSEVHNDSGQLLWASSRNQPPPVVVKKATVTGKMEKTSRIEVGKLRPGVLTKVKAVKKLSQPDSASVGESSQMKVDEPHTLAKLVDRLPGAKSVKVIPTENLKPNAGATVSKDWNQCKNSSRTLLVKAGKVDIALPGPSSGEQSGFQGSHFASAGSCFRMEQKLKSSVLRSLEKGTKTKSRLLGPVRRRSSDGKKSRKNLDRKPSCSENSINTTSGCTLRNDVASDSNCAN